MTDSNWYSIRRIDENTALISEPPHVNSYLLTGTTRAILFDTGMGMANIKRVVDQLTDLEVMVVNSHYHFDHSGGNALFDKIAIHELGAEPLGAGVPAEWLSMYTEFTHDMLAAFKVYKDLDDRYFHLLTADLLARPLPDGFDSAAWQIPPTIPSQLLKEGDVLDLGGRSLRVLHTPGHTPDGICLFDEASGTLFAGDTLTTGPHYAHMPDSDVTAFARSTRRLDAELREKVTAIYPAHILRNPVDAAFMTEVADGFEAVLNKDVAPRPGKDIFGDEVHEYWFDRFSIVLAGDPSVTASVQPE